MRNHESADDKKNWHAGISGLKEDGYDLLGQLGCESRNVASFVDVIKYDPKCRDATQGINQMKAELFFGGLNFFNL